MPTFQHGETTVHYEESGSGPALLVIPGGGLNATIAGLASHAFNPMTEFSDRYRCVGLDLRNANSGGSHGPLETARPWDAHTDDQLALMDHLGIDRFMVLGFCIGGPLIWNLLRRAGDRVGAATLVHPSGFRSDRPDIFYQNNLANWAPTLCEQREDIDLAQVEAFLSQMYRSNPDFVFTVDRDFVRQCETPVLILPDDIPPHPYATAMETAFLSPNAQVSIYPWKEDEQKVRIALRHVSLFLAANATH